MRSISRLVSGGVMLLLVQACSCQGTVARTLPDGGHSSTSSASSSGSTGSSGTHSSTGSTGSASSSSGGSRGGCDGGQLCGSTCCARDSLCVGQACEPLRQGSARCTSDSDCLGDSFCDAGTCVAWTDGGYDAQCVHTPQPAHFSPSIRCAWPPALADGGYAASPDPLNIQVITTPLVADFGLFSTPHPLLVFPSQNSLGGGDDECEGTAAAYGVLRILDPQSCELVATLDAADQHVVGSSTPAIGDLDGDGRPDIVASAVGGGLVAFTVLDGGTWRTLWHSRLLDGGADTLLSTHCNWAGPSLADIDGDGLPEVAFGGAIYDRTGLQTGGSLSGLYYSQGQIPVLANVDLVGGPELVTGNAIYTFDATTHDWTSAPYFVDAGQTDGFVAIGRFGTYPVNGVDPGYPQVAVVSGGAVRVQTIGGELIFGPYALPASNGGGPPTIGDFNGDGQPDIAAAGSDSYTVFSFHCVADGGSLPADCLSPGVLWTRQSQDHSSNVTGSSLFDFTGSGIVSGIYADECFARVYDGPTGDVTYSQWHSSCTWYENPIVADVLANYSSQLVVISNQNCGVLCTGSTEDDGSGRQVDKTFNGLTCVTAADCPSAADTCQGGLCRCSTDDGCCGTPGACPASGFGCGVPPDAGQPGLGNTCRALYLDAYPGIRIYADAQNRWVDSRSIWNQHAYAVTNIDDDGTVPAASAVRNNWGTSGLDNFRQQVQGGLAPLGAAHLTIAFTAATCNASGAAVLDLEVCNRGAGGVAGDVPVTVQTSSGTSICSLSTASQLGPGVCTPLSCMWTPPSGPQDLEAIVDSSGVVNPCETSGNEATLTGFECSSGLK